MTSVASCFDAWVTFSNSPELDASARAPHTKYRRKVGGKLEKDAEGLEYWTGTKCRNLQSAIWV